MKGVTHVDTSNASQGYFILTVDAAAAFTPSQLLKALPEELNLNRVKAIGLAGRASEKNGDALFTAEKSGQVFVLKNKDKAKAVEAMRGEPGEVHRVSGDVEEVEVVGRDGKKKKVLTLFAIKAEVVRIVKKAPPASAGPD